MDGEQDKASDSAEGEDIPSDFFDEFNKEEFIEGLSVIDSWDDAELDAIRKHRHDLDELSLRSEQKLKERRDQRRKDQHFIIEDKNVRSRENSSVCRFPSDSNLDDYIKPGSRRDPSKTNEAIRRDKEVKVKEYLAKQLDSNNEIRPPGTELDDFFSVGKSVKLSKNTSFDEVYKSTRHSRSQDRRRRFSPKPWRVSPKQRYFKRDRYYSPRRSPRCVSKRSWRPSPVRSSKRHSPKYHTSRRYSPKRPRYSRSPDHSSNFKSHRSPSQSRDHEDGFLYPNKPRSPLYNPNPQYQKSPVNSYAGAPTNDFHIPGPSYAQGPVYTGGFSGYDGYAMQSIQQTQPSMPVPQTGHLPVMNSVSAPVMNLGPTPPMVPAPIMESSTTMATKHQIDNKSPYDALAQLVAEGKLSQADYLKLAPNRGGIMTMDDKTRVMVLSRCDEAICKLTKLFLPNRLLINNTMLGPEPKSLTSKYCSPLKRQPTVEFHFTKSEGSLNLRQNKQLLDSIIASIGLDKTFSKLKKRSKDIKDAAVQTTKPYCDICEIRESMKINDVGTSIDSHQFCSTVYTQVVEEDLMNSKSIFNPSGSVSISGPISIAHLTPAQLVSQLAARAKTLKQTETSQSSNQLSRRNVPNNYDRRGGGQQYHYNNYHY